ncbi:MAG: hypothetical protein RJA22_1639 [Verrucomicrobiota bacterium]|jgi:predicted membrane metal-binding protein
MDIPEPQIPPSTAGPVPAPLAEARPDAQGVLAALVQENQDMRRLLNGALVALVCLALGVNLFFFKQMRLVEQQVNEQRPVVLRTEAEFQRNRQPEITQFLARLQAYAATRRDFQSNVLDRYRSSLPQYLNRALVPVPATAPGPGPVVAPPAGR